MSSKVSALTEDTAPLAGNLLLEVDDPGGTPASKKILIGSLNISNGPVQGGLINGYISRTVASSNLTVAIKTLAGSDPSAVDPVYVRIGNTVRVLTSALSVTKNAGTNYAAAGGSELAASEIDWFTIMGYNATDGVTLGFTRYLPANLVYGSWSATSTNEKYAAISTITNAAATDEYEVVGMFNATLSAAAAYNWSVPATSIIISKPVYETRWLTWTPTHGTSGGYTNAPTTNRAAYKITKQGFELDLKFTYNATSGGLSYSYVTLPFTPAYASQAVSSLNGTSGVANSAQTELTAPGRLYIYKYDGSTPIVNSNVITANGKYTV